MAGTTAFAFFVEASFGIMILIPLMFTEALPKAMTMTFLAAPPPLHRLPRRLQRSSRSSRWETDIVNNQLRTPTKIPKKVEMIKEEEAPPPMASEWSGAFRAASRAARWVA